MGPVFLLFVSLALCGGVAMGFVLASTALGKATLAMVLAAPFAALVFAWALERPQNIPYYLIVGCYFSMFNFKLGFGDFNVRPNMVVLLASAAILGCRLLLGMDAWRRIPYLKALGLVGAAYTLSTLLYVRSQFFVRGLADCVLYFVNLAHFGLMVRLLSENEKLLEKATRFLMYSSLLYCSSYVLAFLAGRLDFGILGAIFVNLEGETGAFSRISGFSTTQASFISFPLVFQLGSLLVARERAVFGGRLMTLACGTSLMAFALTFARGPWLAFAMTTAAMMVFCLARFSRKRVFLKTGVRLAASLSLVLAASWLYVTLAPGTMEMLATRAEGMWVLDTGTADDRITLWHRMWEDFKTAPVLGHGAHAYAAFLEAEEQITENFPLELLHSAGLVGGGLFLLVNFLVVRKGMGRVWTWDRFQRNPLVFCFLFAYLCLFLASLTNPGMTGGMFWVALGLLVTSLRLGHDGDGPEARLGSAHE